MEAGPQQHADDDLPEAPAPAAIRSHVVKERYKFPGWSTPPGNLVVVYLEACERHKVPANSAVIAQLHRRVRLVQSGPWQRISPPPPPEAPGVRAPSPDPTAGPPAPSPTSSQLALEAAQTTQELKDMIFNHVYPLGISGAASSVGDGLRGGGGEDGESGRGGRGSPAPSSALHAATLGSAALAAKRGAGVLYSDKAVSAVCRLVDPRTPWHQQRAAAGLANGSRVLSEEEFRRLLDAAASGLPLGELRQAALEVLSRPVGHGTLDVEGLLGALFDYLDVTVQGTIPASDLRTALSAFCPAAAADIYGLIERHPPLARPGSEPVTREEFVEVLAALAPALAPPGSSAAAIRDRAELAVNAILDSKIREPFAYDFSRAYLGPRGLLPVLDALGRDPTFVRLSLANCGLGCSAVERLAGWLQGHPCLTSLDLSNNLIADRGGMALTRLLEGSPRIVELGIGATALVPSRPSRTHHNVLGPSPCEDGRALLAALAANRAARRASASEIVATLRQHGPELRALCYSLLAREGGGEAAARGASRGGPDAARVPLGALREALGEVTAEWGFTPEALDEVLQHERLLGTATAHRTADDSGRLGVSFEELMHFLRSEDQATRVARAFRNRLADAKEIFFSLAPPESTAAAAYGGGAIVSGPRTSLSTIRQAIVAAASQPGSGWDVSENDLEAVLSPDFLRPHLTAAPTGHARPQPAGLAVSPWGVMGADGLLQPDWATGSRVGSSALGPQASWPQPSDMLISWPELFGAMLYLFNR
ncbi:hypothetical protein GPECTOR_17g880 [Gonium pectorale]|uniref:EF-hand domain-containing protein n=1 Tax=Gonium pectorale TaxID=33097 RepID=A0A150GKB9_GONPE|nr:hypothetical protein GPECTOR_17g880 [Gonium pectorale]|eukprot:KXZ50242.1 hypothetical protein GPECTOR_17g880 [Gonium pectorale]